MKFPLVLWRNGSDLKCFRGVSLLQFLSGSCSGDLLLHCLFFGTSGICFLKSSMDANNRLTSLGCSRPDFWRSLVRLSELLLSSFHPDILVCHLFDADSLSKAALAIQNSILSTCIVIFTVAIVCLSMKSGHRLECLSLLRHCMFLNCAF